MRTTALVHRVQSLIPFPFHRAQTKKSQTAVSVIRYIHRSAIGMEFEVLAKCPTTNARVSRMKLAREFWPLVVCPCALILFPDGVTMLPAFMPVATQAAIKGLTPQQVESLGITLILNNTYHLNLRPGTQVLKEAGGAHKFQNWNHNLLTVSLGRRS